MITLDRRREYGGDSIPYQRIDYLESTGTQHIWLPLTANVGDELEVGGVIMPIAGGGTYFAAYPSSEFTMAQYTYNAVSLSITAATTVGGNASNGGVGLTASGKTSFVVSTSLVKYGSTTKSLVRPLSSNINGFFLFAFNAYTHGKVGYQSFYIKLNNVLIYDFVAVRDGQVGYLYDKVSKQLYGNNGTGSFKLGPDCYSKNLLYYWDSEDSIISNYWEDRVKGIRATGTNINKVDGLYELQASDYSTQRKFSLSNLNSGTTKIVLPAAWKCECEFKIPSDVIIGSGKSIYIFDFGSLTQATHAFALNYVTSGLGMNYKPIGNSSNTNYGLQSRLPIELDELVHVEFGTNYVSESDVLLYMKIGDTIVYGKAPMPAIKYDENWNVQYGYFGSGQASSYAGGKVYLKSLKFFNNL